MPYLLKLVLIFVALALLWEGVTWISRRWRLHGLSSFHRWLKDPDYRQAMEAEFQRRKNVTVDDNVPEDVIRYWVMALILKDAVDGSWSMVHGAQMRVTIHSPYTGRVPM